MQVTSGNEQKKKFQVRKHAPQNAVLMLVGNKCDQLNERSVEFIDAERFASEMNISLFEVSAKTGINIEEAFMELASAMRERLVLAKMDHDNYDNSSDSGADEIRSGFHVDGVIGKSSNSNYLPSCCSTASKSGTFV